MEQKLLEIRDAATCIPVLCTSICGADGYLARRAGYGEKQHIFVTKLVHGETQRDPYAWQVSDGRTMHEAHKYIEQHWRRLHHCDVIDVEFILGETKVKKESEVYG